MVKYLPRSLAGCNLPRYEQLGMCNWRILSYIILLTHFCFTGNEMYWICFRHFYSFHWSLYLLIRDIRWATYGKKEQQTCPNRVIYTRNWSELEFCHPSLHNMGPDKLDIGSVISRWNLSTDVNWLHCMKRCIDMNWRNFAGLWRVEIIHLLSFW